jgi:uncharacterized membrane protein
MSDWANQAEWSNEANWSHPKFGIYFSKRDSRLWVPKKFGWGWTLNMGHPQAAWWLVGLLALPWILRRLK